MVACGLTVPGLHAQLNGIVSCRTVWRWHSGKSVPGAEALPYLARALKTTPNALVGWED